MRIPRPLLLATSWWLALLALYLVLVSRVTGLEIVVGVVIVSVTAPVASLAAGPFRPAPPPRAVRWRRLWWLPLDIARDTAVLVVTALRLVGRARDRSADPGGRVERFRLVHADSSGTAAVRAYAVLVLSTSPGSYVLAVASRDHGPDEVALHVVGAPGGAGRAVTR